MSKATRRRNALMRHDLSFRHAATDAFKQKLSRRRYGHVFSEAAHYLNRAAEYRREGRLSEAKGYILATRKILLNGTSWGNIENQKRLPLP